MVNAAGHKSVHRLSCFLPSKLLRVLKKKISGLLLVLCSSCTFMTARFVHVVVEVEEILVGTMGSVRRGGLLVFVLVKAWNFIPFAI